MKFVFRILTAVALFTLVPSHSAQAADGTSYLTIHCSGSGDGELLSTVHTTGPSGSTFFRGVVGKMPGTGNSVYVYYSGSERAVSNEVEHVDVAVFGTDRRPLTVASVSAVLFRAEGALVIDLAGAGIADQGGMSCSITPHSMK